MPWDGSGNFSRTDGTRTGSTVWDQAKTAVVRVNAADHDEHDQDLADGLELALLRDGQNAASDDINLGGNKIENLADGTADDDAATVGQLAGDTVFVPASGVGGTANATTLSGLANSPAAYVAGKGYTFVVELENDDAVTLKEGSKAAVSMRLANGEEFEGGELEIGMVVTAIYNGTRFISSVSPLGDVDFATDAQTEAFSSTALAVTPAGLGHVLDDHAIQVLTQAEYDALGSGRPSTTIYIIVG